MGKIDQYQAWQIYMQIVWGVLYLLITMISCNISPVIYNLIGSKPFAKMVLTQFSKGYRCHSVQSNVEITHSILFKIHCSHNSHHVSLLDELKNIWSMSVVPLSLLLCIFDYCGSQIKVLIYLLTLSFLNCISDWTVENCRDHFSMKMHIKQRRNSIVKTV